MAVEVETGEVCSSPAADGTSSSNADMRILGLCPALHRARCAKGYREHTSSYQKTKRPATDFQDKASAAEFMCALVSSADGALRVIVGACGPTRAWSRHLPVQVLLVFQVPMCRTGRRGGDPQR